MWTLLASVLFVLVVVWREWHYRTVLGRMEVECQKATKQVQLANRPNPSLDYADHKPFGVVLCGDTGVGKKSGQLKVMGLQEALGRK